MVALSWDNERLKPVLGMKLLVFLVVFRVFNALLMRTSFTPDEFWQGPEPAHLLAFGTGHLTWEWEQSARIRGFTHPLAFAAVYKALEIMGLDTRWAVAHSPKLLQGVLAGVCDYYTFGLALRAFGAAAAGWALLFQVLSWFNFYCLVRPYSNSAEAVLATAALFHWLPYFLSRSAAAPAPAPAQGAKGGAGWGASSMLSASAGGETCALLLAALCVAVRPTSAALWALVGLFRLSTLPLRTWPRYLVVSVLPPVASVVGASFYLDSRLYGTATLVPLNFLRFNVLEGNSRIFGEQAWHWNFSQGLPAVLGAALPASLWGFARAFGEEGRGVGCCHHRRRLGWLAVWFLVYHSSSPHKEFRFLLPVLPIAHAYAGWAVSALIARPSPPSSKSSSNCSSPSSLDLARAQKRQREGRSSTIAAALFFLHVPAAIYLSVWHQSGALSAVDAVAKRIPALASAPELAGSSTASGLCFQPRSEGKREVVTVHFLMPCHSAPLHSHLHFRGSEGGLWSGKMSLWSLDCSPRNRELPGGSDSDKFQADPLAFLESTYALADPGGDGAPEEKVPASMAPPDLAVMYDTHLARPGVAEFLRDRLGLEAVEEHFNAHVNGDADSDDTHRSVHMAAAGSPPTFPGLKDTDIDTTADEERTDSLIQGLEAPTDDDDSISDGDGEVGATNAAAGGWPALQYATYMTGTLQFVKEKHRVQGYLAAELARARKELGEDDDDEPTKRPTLEGDIDHYSIQKQITRRQNKKSPGFLSAVRMIWDATRAEMVARLGGSCGAGGNEVDAPGIDKAAFVCLMVKVHYLIICPPVDREVAHTNACKDWARDNTDGGRYMSYELFVASIFELVDLWTETLESKEYDALAMLIANGVTTEVEITEALPDSTDMNKGVEGTGRVDSVDGKLLRVTRSFMLKADTGIAYDPKITKEPVYMEDLLEEVDDDDEGDNVDGGDGPTQSPETAGRGQGDGRAGRNAGKGEGKRLRRVVDKRFGGVSGFRNSLQSPASPDSDAEDDGAYAAVSGLSRSGRPPKTALLSTERVNAQIAKVFAELTGVSVMVQRRPYAERAVEFRPFACSDFIIPMLTKLCPQGEKMDRWLGNGKVPVAVTTSDFMQAVKEVCPDVPTECPAFVTFVVQVGRLGERLEKRCREEKLTKPNAARTSVDLDEALMIAMPVWSAEEEYLIMKVTLNAVRILRQWMQRWRRRKEAGEPLPQHQRHPRVKTARRTKRPPTATAKQHKKRSFESPLAPDSANGKDMGVAELEVPGRRQLRESASSPAGIANAARATCAVSTPATTILENPAAAIGETEESDSPRARQRLEQAKELDQKVAASQGGGGG
eukprot:g14021.t1